MHGFLKERMVASSGPDMQIRPHELEEVGASMGLSTSEAAVLFRSMEGAYWWGTLHEVEEESDWVLAVVDRVAWEAKDG